MAEQESVMTYRDRALLHAVVSGRVEVTCSCEPDLFIDGFACCDQTGARRLIASGLIAVAGTGRPGIRVRATLTETGARLINEMTAARPAA